MNSAIVTAVGFVLNLAIGYFVKKGATPVMRKLIPILSIAIGVLTQAVAAMNQALPPVALVSTTVVAQAGFFFHLGNAFADALVNGIIQGLLATGAQSGRKNVLEGIALAKKR